MIVAVQLPERALAFDFVQDLPSLGEIVQFDEKDYMVVGCNLEGLGAFDLGIHTLRLESVGIYAG